MKNVKKTISAVAGIAFLACVCMAGCNSSPKVSDNENEDSSSDVVINNGQEWEAYDIEHYKEGLCGGRISIEECAEQYSQDIEELYVMSEEDHGITTQESWDYLEEWLDSIGKRDLVDMEKEVRIVTPEVEWDETQEFPYSYPALCEHMDLSSGGGAFITTTDCHMQISYDGAYSMSDGKMNQYLQDTRLASKGALGAYSDNVVAEGAVSQLADESWPLISGELTVGEGAELVKSYFEAGTPFPLQEGVALEVPEVRVFTLGDVYGYDYFIQRIYKGIPIAYRDYGTFSEPTYGIPNEDVKNAYVVDTEGVSAYCGKNASAVLTELYSDHLMLGLSRAVQMMSENIAPQVNIDVKEAGLEYVPVTFSSESGSITLFPCWRFSGTNLVKGEEMVIYADVLTGELYYYTM